MRPTTIIPPLALSLLAACAACSKRAATSDAQRSATSTATSVVAQKGVQQGTATAETAEPTSTDTSDADPPAAAPDESATMTGTATATTPAAGTATAVYVDPDDMIADPHYPSGASRREPAAEACVPAGAAFPAILSATGCFASLQPTRGFVDGALNYAVRLPFHAGPGVKERALFLPAGARLGFKRDGAWTIPTGTRAVKTFLTADGRPIETRILRVGAPGSDGLRPLEGVAYVWRSDGSEADLAGPDAATLLPQAGGASWRVPARDECEKCHAAATGPLLGITTAQLNTRAALAGVTEHAFNQIDTLARYGYADGVPTPFEAAALPRHLVAEQAPLDSRARAWLAVNCASCHAPGGFGNAFFDLRPELPQAALELCNVDDAQGDMDVPDSKLIVPGAKEKSVLWLRLTSPHPEMRMPQLASGPSDAAGIALIGAWIDQGASCP